MTHDPDEPRDTWARALLQHAGDTVDVGPAGRLGVMPARRRWLVPALAAAAAVAVVVGSVTAVAIATGRDPASAPPAAPVSSSRPADDGGFRLGPDQVPSLFGQTQQSAVATLGAMSLEVTVTRAPTCEAPAGVPIRSVPPTGTIVAAGDPVDLVVSSEQSSAARCTYRVASPFAYDVLHAALGTGPALNVGPGVDVEPALALVRLWAGEVDLYRDGQRAFPTPSLASGPPQACGEVPLPDGYGVIRRTVSVVPPVTHTGFVDGVVSGCQTVLLDVDRVSGRIERVSIPRAVQTPPATGDVPPVAGNSLAAATSRLTADGYRVVPIPRTDCGPLGLVTTQSPFHDGRRPPGSTVYVGYTATSGPCLDAEHLSEFPGQPIPTPDPSTERPR